MLILFSITYMYVTLDSSTDRDSINASALLVEQNIRTMFFNSDMILGPEYSGPLPTEMGWTYDESLEFHLYASCVIYYAVMVRDGLEPIRSVSNMKCFLKEMQGMLK